MLRYHLLRMLSKGLELEEDLILQLVVSRRRLDSLFLLFFGTRLRILQFVEFLIKELDILRRGFKGGLSRTFRYHLLRML